MKVIIAGNHRQAQEYVRTHMLLPGEYIEANSPEKLYGLRDVEIIRTGEYWLNPANDDERLRYIEKND